MVTLGGAGSDPAPRDPPLLVIMGLVRRVRTHGVVTDDSREAQQTQICYYDQRLCG